MTRLLSQVTGRAITSHELDQLAHQSLNESPSFEALFAPQPPANKVIGEFEILAELGRGGMGVVYLARQLSLGRLVALKMLPEDLAGDEVVLARFRREIRILGRCDDPHIVKVLTTGTLPDGHLYYAMEYVPGANLEIVWRELADARLPPLRRTSARPLGPVRFFRRHANALADDRTRRFHIKSRVGFYKVRIVGVRNTGAAERFRAQAAVAAAARTATVQR